LKIHQKINLKKQRVGSDYIISRMAENDSCPSSERSLRRSCKVKVVGSMSILYAIISQLSTRSKADK